MNGRIYTVNEDQPWAEAVAVKDGKFFIVGSVAEVEAAIGNDTDVVDLESRFVMPGIFDLHSHPFITPWYGSMNLELTDPGDREKTLQEVKAYADANPDKEWILGGQWLLGTYQDDNPKKEWLDAVVPDRPVNLLDQTGHSSWLNSKALELAGITAETPTSNLVVIEKDPVTGEPTGTIREQALQLPERVTPQASAETYADVIEGIFNMYLSYGVTSQQTAEGHRAPMDALKFLEENSRLHQRVFVSWDWKTTLNLAYTIEDIEKQIENRSDYESELVKPNWVKIFSDGGPNAGTSLLLEPYEGEPDNYGNANMSTEEFAEAFIRFDRMGVGLHVHSIGDGSIRRVVDALEKMKEANGDSGVKHKISHNAMITPEDIQRLAAMKDVNIDFSPPVFYPHAGIAASFTPKVGEDRVQRSYPVRSALASGLHVGQGADWLTANPTPNPFWAIEGLVTRANPFDPNMTGTLNPSEAITLEQAIAVSTIEGAHVLGEEENLGSIAAGKHADMIVLDQNLFEVEDDEIGDTQVLRTILNGKTVFER
jgi:predicted amidohydrolase YtcJ